MGTDFYRVEVLYYINPHLIWVEVKEDPCGTRANGITFEQIGIYGLMPREPLMEIDDYVAIAQTCDLWEDSAISLMKRYLKDAVEVFFTPTYIDRRTSIFDSNIHKYGDLIIFRKSGKYKQLSKELVKSGYAIQEECLFHQQLSSGILIPKLDEDFIDDIIIQLENHYKKKNQPDRHDYLRKITKVFNIGKTIDSSLTVENLATLNATRSKKLTHEEFLQQKVRDMRLCKDIDEEPAGRANRWQKSISLKGDDGKDIEGDVNKKSNSLLLKKKLNISAFMQNRSQGTLAVENFIKYLDTNSKTKDEMQNTMSAPFEIKAAMEALSKAVYDGVPDTNEEVNPSLAPDLTSVDALGDVSNRSLHLAAQMKMKSSKKATKSKKKNEVPEYDTRTQKRVAYGPPEIDRSKLPLKIVDKSDLESDFNNTEQAETIVELPKTRPDDFGDVDSDVETAEVSEINVLKITEAVKLGENEIKLEEIDSNAEEKNPLAEVACDTFYSKSPVPSGSSYNLPSRSLLKKKLHLHNKHHSKQLNSSSTPSDTSNKDSSTSAEEFKPKKVTKKYVNLDSDSDDDSGSEIIKEINLTYPASSKSPQMIETNTNTQVAKNHANPFKNVDPDISVFVEKLVTPVLMVHTKNKRIQPTSQIRDVPFGTHIQIVLKNLSIDSPMMLQRVSWWTILRGYSVFMISPKGSGKTMGYLPAVCRLVSFGNADIPSVGPICIIVCATASCVSDVENLARMFLMPEDKVQALYPGMNELHLTTAILNGCDLLICTPMLLVRLLQSTDFGIDLRRLTTFVLDDCERLAEVYGTEIKFFLLKIKEMFKNRAAKELCVQYILASRVWCDFMRPLALKAPNSVISIGAFQECVLYGKANMSASFIAQDKKINAVLDFLKENDISKKTVIVCRTDEEVETVHNALKKTRSVVIACDNTMTVQDLYKLSIEWNDYQEPTSGPILVCRDGNLTHMNITDAHYLVHYSLPHLFSMFCKRFAVLNDHYASMFESREQHVRIKILLDDNNTDQLPKVVHFIKRCTDDVPKVLNEICEKVLIQKDAMKAANLVPICDTMLALGECPDFWNCQQRHAILKQYDEPEDWVPTSGIVTFKLLHYHNAVLYSARLVTHVVNGLAMKFPQSYTKLSMKLATFYAKESNRKLHGTPKVGDICAVSMKQNFFVRCQVVKILSHNVRGTPNNVLIRLIEEERYVKSRDIYLYHLPEEMKKVQTHVVNVRLSNIQPRDRDITFSELAKEQLNTITDKNDDLYMRAQISLTIGNCLFVDNLETCRDLPSMNKTVVRHNFKQELEAHAVPNPNHIDTLMKLCEAGGLAIKLEKQELQPAKPLKALAEGRWAHLDKDDFSLVIVASANDPGTFFVRLVKFKDCMTHLIKDIQNHIAEKNEKLTEFKEGDIVLAKFPDDDMYERARIDSVFENQVKCFFVDGGDWREVSKNHLAPITDKLLTQMPFQAIECRLIGVKPASYDWTEFGTNWFTNCFEDISGQLNHLYAKYFTKEKALYSGGHKYGIALIDTNGEKDVIINQMMIDLNLAREHEKEFEFLINLDLKCIDRSDTQTSDDDHDWEKISNDNNMSDQIPKSGSAIIPINNILLKPPIRSVPLVDSDFDDDDIDINFTEDFFGMLKQNLDPKLLAAIEDAKAVKIFDTATKMSDTVNSQSGSDARSSVSDMQIIPSPRLAILDSDDNTTPDRSDLSATSIENNPVSVSIDPGKKPIRLERKPETDLTRRPTLRWLQTLMSVKIKIFLIGVESYDLKISDKHLTFDATVKDIKYAFDFELYGVVDAKRSLHANKGQYIHVNLRKIHTAKWLTLTTGGPKYFIYHDMDHIHDSSDEEIAFDLEAVKALKKRCLVSDTDSDDEGEVLDDVNFRYK